MKYAKGHNRSCTGCIGKSQGAKYHLRTYTGS